MPQHSLFPISIPGLSYIADFIGSEIADALLREIDAQAWSNELKRRVQHYGYRYDYKARSAGAFSKLGALPAWLSDIGAQMVREKIFTALPEQVIVNEYLPGQGISAHTDCIPCFGEVIASLSLGSPCVMDFTRAGEKASFLLEPRSLIILSGEARYVWQHGIAHRKTDRHAGMNIPRGRRVSLTFRTMAG